MKKTVLFDVISNSTEETEHLGEKFAWNIKSTEDKSIFVAMYGDLGAGKTAFVRGAARILAPKSQISSPTYTIVNEYTSGKSKFCHFDMYRITDEEDLFSIGFYDYLDYDMIVEWSEKIEYALPKKYFKVQIEKLDDMSRRIIISRVSEE